jgi:hypothetical protein
VVAAVDTEAGTIEIRHDGTTVLEPSPLGLTTPEGSFPGDVPVAASDEATIDETFRTPSGKRRQHRHRAVQRTFTAADEGGAEMDVRVATDGVAYRYRVPGEGRTMVFGEDSGFHVPAGSNGWLHPQHHCHESIGRTDPIGPADGEFGFPATVQTPDDDWLLLAEAGVDGNYAASHLRTGRWDHRLDLVLPEPHIRPTLPLETPWRVAVVGDLSTVVESSLVPALVDGPRLDDQSWIRPGRVAWSWWSESSSPADFERQREYVDYASARGWEHVLVDAGWEREWMPDLVEYADERDVGVFVWVHWMDVNTERKRAERLPEWRSWGVEGIKVDFMNSDEHARMQFYDDLMAATAEHELMVNLHGSVVPTGLRRRWPHVLTYEGVMGAEHYSGLTLSPAHNTILPFTRNVVGPMDYTPVVFSADHRHTTVGHELALSVVFESGLQHFADGIDTYAARPVAESFLERVPPVWDETRLLRGRPGSEATIARRSGEDWFVGCVTAGAPRSLDLEIPALDGHRTGTLVRDDESGESLVSETVDVGADDGLSVSVPSDGGFCVHLPR